MIKCECLDCNLPYEEFGLDTTLSNKQWLMIHPGGDGLLCANCIAKRAGKIDGAIAIRAEIEVEELE